MRFRDSAAAVLVGWLLMAPTIDCAREGLQRQTPLSEWESVESFTSDESCENYRSIVIAAENSDSASVERYAYSICVPDNDPRLAVGTGGQY